MSTIKRLNHYVWKKYLEPWSTESKVWCLRKGNNEPFPSNPKNLGVEKDFYRLESLQQGDEEFIKRFLEPIKNPRLVELNKGWLSNFQFLFNVIAYVHTHHNASELIQKEAMLLLNSYEEEMFTQQENASIKYLNALLTGDTSFYDDGSEATGFLFYLMQQYFRTKKIKELCLNEVGNREQWQRCWPILRYFFVTNIGLSLYSSRETMRLTIVDSPPEIDFITCDQPVMNTYGAFQSDPRAMVTDMELYYPISPRRAVLLTENSDYLAMHGKTISPFRVQYLNQVVESSAYEQIFAHSKASLSGLRFSN